MKGLYCLLVVSLYTLGSICVDCYTLEEANEITYAGSVRGNDCTKGALLLTGDLDAKSNLVRTQLAAEGVVLRNAHQPGNLKKAGVYYVNNEIESPVIALLVHDNPIVILSTNYKVYYCR